MADKGSVMTRENIHRRLLGEFTGTAFLLATVIGSGIMAERLADGNNALALLGNTIPTGAILVVLILVFGPLSGAHFNPAVTLAFACRGEFPWTQCLPYIAAQVAGGVLGMLAAHAMFDVALLQVSVSARSGPSQWLSEVIATFGLLMAIFGALKWKPELVAYTVGLYITAAYWFTASTSFANPAVTFARAFTDSFSGIAPVDAPGFIIAEFAGAILAAWFFRWLFKPSQS